MASSQPEATNPDAETPEAAQQPFLRIVSGNPDDIEVAALTSVFAGLAQAAEAAAQKESAERNKWGDYSERLDRPITYNPNAFRNVTFY